MRRSLILCTTVVLVALATASAVSANASRTLTACKERGYNFAGAVVALGSSSLTVEVDRTGSHDPGLGGRRLDVSVGASTKITRDGAPILLSAILKGEQVAV